MSQPPPVPGAVIPENTLQFDRDIEKTARSPAVREPPPLVHSVIMRWKPSFGFPQQAVSRRRGEVRSTAAAPRAHASIADHIRQRGGPTARQPAGHASQVMENPSCCPSRRRMDDPGPRPREPARGPSSRGKTRRGHRRRLRRPPPRTSHLQRRVRRSTSHHAVAAGSMRSRRTLVSPRLSPVGTPRATQPCAAAATWWVDGH